MVDESVGNCLVGADDGTESSPLTGIFGSSLHHMVDAVKQAASRAADATSRGVVR